MHLGGESPQSHKICLFEVFAKDAVANYPEYFRNEQWCKYAREGEYTCRKRRRSSLCVLIFR